jgi:hypothetical protein
VDSRISERQVDAMDHLVVPPDTYFEDLSLKIGNQVEFHVFALRSVV